jgi:uncharacterized membrane protein YbhN (UPF0104 family)
VGRDPDLTWLELATLVAIAGWNLSTYAWVWMAVTPGLSFWRAMAITQATTAVANTIPAGIGAGSGIGMTYTMLGSWGVLAVQVDHGGAGLRRLEQLHQARPAGPCFGAGAPTGWCWRRPGHRGPARHRRAGGRGRGVRADAAQPGAGAPVRAAGRSVATRLLGLVRRPPVAGWELATVKFRSRTVGLVQRRWLAITVTSLVSHLSLYLVLLVTLRHVGVSAPEVSWAEVLAVFAFARLATAIPSLPAGPGSSRPC